MVNESGRGNRTFDFKQVLPGDGNADRVGEFYKAGHEITHYTIDGVRCLDCRTMLIGAKSKPHRRGVDGHGVSVTVLGGDPYASWVTLRPANCKVKV